MRDTIDMAREAGLDAWWDSGSDWRETFDEHLKAFEALVRADEREIVEDLLKEYDMVNSAFAKDFRARGHT
jgi:hypothetical protein